MGRIAGGAAAHPAGVQMGSLWSPSVYVQAYRARATVVMSEQIIRPVMTSCFEPTSKLHTRGAGVGGAVVTLGATVEVGPQVSVF